MTLLTLPQLLSDERYRDYFKRTTKTFNSPGDRWQVVAIRPDGKYGTCMRPTFREAWVKTRELLATNNFEDVSIVSRNRVFATPVWAPEMMDIMDDWCGRCRRPTRFWRYGRSHPALKHAPCIVEDVRRCYYCGISKEYLSGRA